MPRFFSIALATILITATPVTAQKGQQVFDLLLQGAQQEVYRQQQREHDRRQRREVNRLYQQFVAEWQSCHGGDLGACDRALTFPQVNTPDRNSLLRKRAEIIATEQAAIERTRRERYEAELAERQKRDRTAAKAQERLRHDAEQKRQSEDAYRQRVEQQLQALLDEREREKTAASAGSGTLLASGVALLLLAIVGLLGFVFRAQLRAVSNAVIAKVREAVAFAQGGLAATMSEPDKQAEPAKPPIATTPRDTPGAIAAMELALAYIQEVQDADRPGLEDKAERKQQLNTLALAAKQLDLAQRLDADAIFEGQIEDVTFRFTINELKAEALVLEGVTHQVYDVRRAIPALMAATTLNPNSARAFYLLGLTHAANMSKAKAVAAFEQAVALDPKNIAYRKELNRVQNLSGAEVAAYRATRTAEKVVDNTVMAWNVFAVIWNVLTFPLRVVVGIFRMLRLHPFA